MAEQLILDPLLFIAVINKINEDNPKAVETGLAHIHISVAEGFQPEMLSNVQPEAMYEILEWILKNREARTVDEIVVGPEGPTDSDTIQ